MRYTALWLLAIAVVLSSGCSDDAPVAPAADTYGPSMVLLPNTGYTYVSAGANFVCGIRSDGTVLCWGGNGPGELDTPQLADAIQLANGSSHTCALRATRTVTCWGVSEVPAGLAGVSYVSAGAFHTCAIIESDGSVVCWGSNADGQTDVPAGLTSVVAVGAGYAHTCAARSDGSVLCWGRNDEDQGTPPADLGPVKELAGGGEHTCALRTDGSVVCWGSNSDDQLAVPDDLAGAVSISSGFSGTCALRSSGAVTCWGFPFSPDDTDVTQISSGYSSVCLLKAGGIIRCIGVLNPPERLFPSFSFHSTASSVMAGQPFTLAFEDMLVLTYSGQVTFTFAFDCADGGGFGPFTASNHAECTIYVGGSHEVRGRIMDNTGDVFERVVRIEVAPDETPPVITLHSPGEGDALLLNETVLAEYTCADDETGIASCDGTLPSGAPIPTGFVGKRSFTVEAENRAGNTATLTHTYSVVYGFSGFSAPVNNDETNVARAGRTIPLTWRLVDANGSPVTDVEDVSVSVTPLICGLDDSATPLPEEAFAGSSGFRNLGNGEYRFNWNTPKSYAGSCMTLHIDMGEGLTHTATFRFTS